MQYNTLADTGVQISSLTAGNTAPMAGVLGDPARAEDAVAALRCMLDAGVNLIDTASSYANGESEVLVGRAIQGIPRDRFLITTKFGMTFPTVDGQRTIAPDLRAAQCIESLEQSLVRMGIDYVDIFMPHIPDYTHPLDEMLEAMQTLRRQGKVRFLGLSNFCRRTIEEVHREMPLQMIEMPYSLIDREYEETLHWARESGISTMVYGALGDGILAGAYKEAPEITDPEDTRAGYPFFFEPDFSKCMTLMETVREIAGERNASPAAVVINWMRQSPAVTTTILGTGSLKHAKANLAALSFTLTEEEVARITATADRTVGRGVNSKRFYDTGGEI